MARFKYLCPGCSSLRFEGGVMFDRECASDLVRIKRLEMVLRRRYKALSGGSLVAILVRLAASQAAGDSEFLESLRGVLHPKDFEYLPEGPGEEKVF
jgi:hypothetical protein